MLMNRRKHYRVDAEALLVTVKISFDDTWVEARLLDTNAAGLGVLIDEEIELPALGDHLEIQLAAGDEWSIELTSVVRYSGLVAEPTDEQPTPPARLGLEFTTPQELYADIPPGVTQSFNRRVVKRLQLPEPAVTRCRKGAEAWSGQTVDLSIYGLGVLVPDPDGLVIGLAVQVELDLPEQRPIEIACRVRHVTSDENTSLVGLQFATPLDQALGDLEDLNEETTVEAIQDSIAVFTLMTQRRP